MPNLNIENNTKRRVILHIKFYLYKAIKMERKSDPKVLFPNHILFARGICYTNHKSFCQNLSVKDRMSMLRGLGSKLKKKKSQEKSTAFAVLFSWLPFLDLNQRPPMIKTTTIATLGMSESFVCHSYERHLLRKSQKLSSESLYERQNVNATRSLNEA